MYGEQACIQPIDSGLLSNHNARWLLKKPSDWIVSNHVAWKGS
jgi:hypothetical protein